MLIRENKKTPMSEEKYLKKLEKIEKKYNDIFNYYYDITSKDNIKMQNNFMQNVRLNKISNNYQKIENNNKVQNISRRKFEEDTIF